MLVKVYIYITLKKKLVFDLDRQPSIIFIVVIQTVF